MPTAPVAADQIDLNELLVVLTAVRNGDFSARMPLDRTGLAGKVCDVLNEIVELNEATAGEVRRISDVVGRQGRLSQRADVRGAKGAWWDSIDSVNELVNNLAHPMAEITRVIGAVAQGDLTRTVPLEIEGRPLEGEFQSTARLVNEMVGQLGSFTSEVNRVSREVGIDGKLGGQARLEGLSGTWKDLTDNVNLMASNLTAQVRNIAEVTTAVANGDLSKKITVDVKGEIWELKNTINVMVDQLGSFAAEVTRVAREVGSEGKLGGQADVKGVSGVWKDLTDNVNSMASNLTAQVRNIAEVTTAVAKGDLSKKITVAVQGEILELKNTINVMVDQLGSFASEVTRVAREVGTEGKLGGQADVQGVSGVWKDLTDNVNLMGSNLTAQVRNIAEVTTAVAKGDLSKKITVSVRGEILELKNTINVMVDQLSSFAAEVTRVAWEVGTEGKLGGQADVQGVSGTWKDLTDNVNSMASNLTAQVRNIAEVTTAVANGELSKKITVDVKGEILELKNTINVMVDQLGSFAAEVTRVAREVGTEGKLGGQADVKGVSGVWKDLTDNVNSMASNLTDQVRGIANVVTAVAAGDLKRKLALEAKGEIAALAYTINGMIDTLAIFADQVTNVAREVGIEGKLGGQARVPGAAGIWRALTDNVNQLAANLTTQVRAIAEVATAVTKGDLTRSIAVEAQGEVASLKDNINQMILNLRETTRKNNEQDWLKTNLAKFSRLLQGQRKLEEVSRLILNELAPLVTAQHGLFYVMSAGEPAHLELISSYADGEPGGVARRFALGQGLVGQCAVEKQRILVGNVPDGYVRISSGLGEGPPRNIVVLPVVFEGEVKAVIELASFERFSDIHLTFLDQLTESIGIVLNTIAASMRTEELLKQSTTLADELRSQQEELQQTNVELEERSRLLQLQNAEVERKNREIEQAKLALEDRARQLATASKYKSEFLANMSHELRTPLNSLLILSRLLAENGEGNLSQGQVEFAETIHESGTDLLTLINDILDLSRIESGHVSVEVRSFRLAELTDFVERTFRQVAFDRGLAFEIVFDPSLPEVVHTDGRRLQQILKNLLANAFKFTQSGAVTLHVAPAAGGWSASSKTLQEADSVLAFSVRDTGIGIPRDKQRVIFEAFQQADGTTSRKYGGTGLGLSISRELAGFLGGEIQLESVPGEGSTFTLYLPTTYRTAEAGEEDGAQGPAQFALDAWEAGASLPVDDRHRLDDEDRKLLIIERDPTFAAALLEQARTLGFKGIFTYDGEEGLRLARELAPDAITLEVDLVGADGWSVLDRLKHDPSTRHIPVQIITSAADESLRAHHMGALGWLSKSASAERLSGVLERVRGFLERPSRQLLVVAAEEPQRQAITRVVGNGDVEATTASTGTEALEILAGGRFDCVVLDPGLPDSDGLELVERIKEVAGPLVPVVVYTDEGLSEQEAAALRQASDAMVVKGVGSPEALFEETSLFLHRPARVLTERERGLLRETGGAALSGRTVLIVDDDIRNIFALTSLLEREGMTVLYAENGREGLEVLSDAPRVDAVLLDIMMPEMDGYETTRAIRAIPDYADLPIIALTAKAMKGDREKCIAAGAWDYVTKPVDTGRLLSVLRVWLGGQRPAPLA